MLPRGWAEATLDSCSESIQYGLTATSNVSGTGYRYIRITDIQNRQIQWATVPFADADNDACAKLSVARNDILFARTGATVGKSYIVDDVPHPATFASYLIRVRCDGRALYPKFAGWFFQSPDYWRKILTGAEGTGQPNFNGSKLSKMTLRLPPLAEQRRIVAKLDALTARLGRARAELDRVPSLAALVRLKTLREAFFWEAPYAEIPEGWSYQRLDQIGSVQLGRQRSPKDHSGPNMRPYVRAANISWMGWELSDVKEMNFSDIEFASYRLKPGDVLLNEGSGSPNEVGKPAVWRGEIEDVCFQNTLLRVRPRSYNPDLLRYCFLYMALSGQFVENTRGVNIAHIGKAGLASKVIPVPPIGNQGAILSSINQAFARADRLEAEAARARALLDRLEAALLAKAFRGELVPQDPADEPASVLLDRIRAERAAAPKVKRGRRDDAKQT